MPLEATQHTGRGAQAFAGFFIKTIDWGYATTSSKYMRHYYAPTCSSCAAVDRSLATAAKLHHRYEGARFTTTRTALARHATYGGAEFTALITFDITSFEEVTKAGKFVRADGAHQGWRYEVSVRWSASKWVVAFLAVDT